MILIYAWVNTTLNRVDGTIKYETKLTYWKNWLVERQIIQIDGWKRKNCKSKHWFCIHSIHASILIRPSETKFCTLFILIECNKYKP